MCSYSLAPSLDAIVLPELTTWNLEAGHPYIILSAHFCKALFFRNAGPTIVFPIPPLRSSRLFHSFNLAALYKEFFPVFSLALSSLLSSPLLYRTATPVSPCVSNSFRSPPVASSQIGKCVLRGEFKRREEWGAASPLLLVGQLSKFDENVDTCWRKASAVSCATFDYIFRGTACDINLRNCLDLPRPLSRDSSRFRVFEIWQNWIIQFLVSLDVVWLDIETEM